MCCCCNCVAVTVATQTVAVDEESEADNGAKVWNGFDKLSDMEAHLIRHRELFLSRQIETYKIDMVR